MPNQIALICTIEKIPGYADSTSDLYALNISTALQPLAAGETFDPTLAGVVDLLQPWKWTGSGAGGSFVVDVWCQTDDADITQGKPVSSTCLAAPEMLKAPQATGGGKPLPDPRDALAASLLAELQGAAAAVPTGDLVIFSNDDPAELNSSVKDAVGTVRQHWPHLLSHASTFPAPVPQALNLVMFFRLPTDPTAKKLYVAPNFVLNGVPYNRGTTSPASAPNPAGSPAINPGTIWAYPASGAQVPVTVFQPGLDLSEPVPETWIQGAAEDGNQDWRTNLDQVLPDSFDLAQRALDAWRALTPTDLRNIFGVPAGSSASDVTDPDTLDVLRVALLSVLRDTADFGLRVAPDNSSLVRFVLSRIGQTGSEIAAIEKKLSAADAGMSFGPWCKTLLNLFPGSLVLQSVKTWPMQCNLENLVALLEEIQTKLATDTTLAQCLYAAWDSVAPENWPAIKSAVQAELNTLANSHTLRKRMLQANIGGAAPQLPSDPQLATWNAIVNIPSGVTDEVTQLKSNLTNLLPAFFASRFGFAQPAGAATLANARQPAFSGTGFPQWQALLAVMNANIASQAANFGSDIFPAGPQPAKEPQPLIVKVQPAAAPDAEADDPLRGMSGVGVLLLQDDETDWSALNVASLYVNVAQTVTPSANAPATPVWVKAAANVFAPYRIHIRNGIRQAAISYDNEPLIARSPLADMAVEVPVDGAAFATQANPLFQFGYNPDPVALLDNTKLDAWARIYGLKFGRSYSLLPFRMPNSGALPVELTDGTNPLALQPPKQFPFKSAPPNVAAPRPITHASYLRRVPVAHPRIYSLGDSDQKLVLPEIPANVFPLARTREKSEASSPSPLLDSAGQPLPLLLLWNNANNATVYSTFSFNVRPPLVNFETWDRWVAAEPDPKPNPSAPLTPTLRKTRAAVNADKVRAAQKSEDDPVPKKTSINDPAIAYVEFRLTAISTDEKAAPSAQYLAVPFPQPLPLPLKPLDGFNQVQSAPCVVTVSIGVIGFHLDPTPNAPKLTLTLPRGEVWKLSITPVVTKDSLGRFEHFPPAMDQFDRNPITPQPTFDQVNPYYRVIAAARELLIEAAAPLDTADTTEALWNSLKLGFDVSSRTLTASLVPSALKRPDLFYKLEITHQAWRWMGRPFTEESFPCELGTGTGTGDDLNSSPLLDNALLWEAQAFAERPLTATHTDYSNINFPILRKSTQDAANDITTVLRTYPETQTLTSADLSNDLRAQYFLFDITAHSRYEGLPQFDENQSITANHQIPSTAATPASTPWKRVFVRARATQAPPPKPKILFCIPLPEPLDLSAAPVTNILAIADEPWPQVAGLAEQIRATIELTRDPSLPLDQASDPTKPPLPEIGSDPILFPTSLGPSQVPIVTFDGLGQPIGTTFDDLSTAPLFANTCFEFALPTYVLDPEAKSPLPIDWYQAKISFTRELAACLTEQPRGSQLVSLPSDPIWVQFLPSSYHFRYKVPPSGDPLPTPLNIQELRFAVHGAGNLQFQLEQQNVSPMAGPAGVKLAAENLELWALVMRHITDAAGKPGQTYGGLYHADDSGDFVPLATRLPPGGAAKSSDSIYLLEVQTDSKRAGAPVDIESALFSATGSTEVTHRIVRMSPCISNQPAPA